MPGCRQHGQEVWGQLGVAVNKMNRLEPFLYSGEVFDDNVCPICPEDVKHLEALWAYVSSDDYHRNVRSVDQAVKVTAATLTKVPFDLEHWTKVAAEKYPDGLPEPYSEDPTQWIFHGHPARAEASAVLQVAVGRLLGYRWPPERDPEMQLSAEGRAWVARCEALAEHADRDGIVCLPALRGERAAADRLRGLLAAAFGADWSPEKERELLAVAGDGKKRAATLDDWLRTRFFEQHCKLFHHRPFVWHVWDGHPEGFAALVNAHHLTGPDGAGRRTLESLTYSYLGDWIDRQRAALREEEAGSEARLEAALDLQGQLEKILEGEPPYDLFVRWKPLHRQAIGWEPDIDDGVRLNLRPFMKATLQKGKAGAGVLRFKPGLPKKGWGKDRGKEPESLRPRDDFPWFWSYPGEGSVEERTDFAGGETFDGNRWNDLHYTRAFKEAARKRKEGEDA